MIQRKFKHTKTAWIAYKDAKSDFYKLFNTLGEIKGALPDCMIENSAEWKDVTEPQLIEGRWYVSEKNNIFRYSYTKDGKVCADNFVGSDYDQKIAQGFVDPELSFTCKPEDVKREAQPKEIAEALEAIRKYKGLSHGLKVQAATWGDDFRIALPTHYNHAHKALYDKNGMAIYDEGNWAIKITEPIMITKDGYKIYRHDTILKEVTDNFEILPIGPGFAVANPVFYDVEKAKKYAEELKPKYSDRDLEILKMHIEENSPKTIRLINELQTYR